jgi:hypothetical protein
MSFDDWIVLFGEHLSYPIGGDDVGVVADMYPLGRNTDPYGLDSIHGRKSVRHCPFAMLARDIGDIHNNC